VSDEPTTAAEQVRELYSELRQLGYPPESARIGSSIALLSNSVSALCTVLRQLAKDRYGDNVPAEITLMTAHAETAALTALDAALGTLLDDPPDGV
jgi:hypothetical protein